MIFLSLTARSMSLGERFFLTLRNAFLLRNVLASFIESPALIAILFTSVKLSSTWVIAYVNIRVTLILGIKKLPFASMPSILLTFLTFDGAVVIANEELGTKRKIREVVEIIKDKNAVNFKSDTDDLRCFYAPLLVRTRHTS